MEARVKIRFHYFVKLLVSLVLNGTDGNDTSIVDQDVDAPEPSRCFLYQPRGFFRLSEVGGNN